MIVRLTGSLLLLSSAFVFASTLTFSDSTLITIPATGTGASTGAPSTPYPSNITVAGVATNPTKVTVTLIGLSHTFPDDLDVLLVGPTGINFILMSDAGGSGILTNVTLTFDDAGATLPDSNGIVSGTFRPANFGTVQDPFPAPAPAGPYLTPGPGGADTLAAFNLANPNGTWSLYVVDDAALDVGTMAGGWSLSITDSAESVPEPASIVLVGAGLVTFTALVRRRSFRVQ